MSLLRRASLYFHTLRHLRASQIWGRLVFRLAVPKPDLAPAPPLRQRTGPWSTPAARAGSLVPPDRFRFLNVEHQVAPGTTWNPAGTARLWVYNLHYFDDLNAIGCQERRQAHRALVLRWIQDNAPGVGPGWEPYPLSLRIVNWAKWAFTGNHLDDAMLASLAVQTRFLAARMEYHLLGNHLFVNAKALAFAGCLFAGQEAGEWLALGLRLLRREIPEQILPDGGHFERSTMYHALAYEDMLDLVNLAAAFPEAFAPYRKDVASWPAPLAKMGLWLRAMCHPDGEIAFFNDAAMGVTPSPGALFAYGRSLGLPVPEAAPDVLHLESSGYIRAVVGDAVLLVDAAPVGPDYLPGHAHADTLSYELSISGQRVVVNSGTSTYEAGPAREAERATSAHSTLVIDDQDSTEVWASFRVARRARTFEVVLSVEAGGITIEAAHDGYRRLPGRPVHRRRWSMTRGSLEVTDLIQGAFASATSHVHFHPGVQVGREGAGGPAELGGRPGRWEAGAKEIRLGEAAWHPEFGSSLPASCLQLAIDPAASPAQCTFRLEWT